MRRGSQKPLDGLAIAACLKDATPDSWGQRVIGNRMGADDRELSIETYLLRSGSSRFGAIDFQESASECVPRVDTASLDVLHDAVEKVLAGVPLDAAIGDALMNGTAIGGAHPKVLVTDDSGAEHIAKLSVSTDVHPVIRAEAVGIELARRCGLDVPNARVVKSMSRDVLLIERFDRLPGEQRRHVVSGLEIVDRIVSTVEAQWLDAADVAGLSEADRNALWKRSVLNRSTFDD